MTSNGRSYFVDHNSRTTTWVDPRSLVNLNVGYLFIHWIYFSGALSSIAQGDPHSEVRVAISQLGQLPLNWEMRVDDHGRSYFINHQTKTTTWDDPRLSPLNE